MKRTTFLLLFLTFILNWGLLEAQEKQVTGNVTDENQNPLFGVSILETGTNNGTATDIDGNFSITLTKENSSLQFSYIGYTPQVVPLNGQDFIRVSLKPNAALLDEVVVVGYGTQKKVNATGSVETIEGQTIARQPVIRTSSALSGLVPGVTATQNSGQPGEDGASIHIRGIGTLGNSNPLILVDGIEGSIDAVNPEDIESISILKDAAAASIYGSRAANGVILVTTKRGELGSIKVNYDGYLGWQKPTNLPKYLGGYEYMTYFNLARENLGQSPLYSQEYIDKYRENQGTDPDHYPNTDWVDEVFTENGFQQSHYLSLSGGNKNIRLLSSFSYKDQNGNIYNYNYKSYGIRINTDITASDKLGFNLDFDARKSFKKEPSGRLGLITRQAFRIPPIFAARYSDGSWGPGWSGNNPVAIAHDGGFENDNYNFMRGVFRVTYNPIASLNLSLMYSPEYSDHFAKEFTKLYQVFNFDTKDLEYTIPSKNSLSIGNYRSFTNNLNALATYNKSVGDHYFKGLLGYELITYKYDWFNSYRDNFPIQDYPQLGVGSQENMQNDGSASEWGLQSYFARANYNFKGKYLFEANVRRDGSSRFAEGNKYGIFPSFSAGWRISEEPFFTSVEFIDNLKFRGSWGRLGNQNIGTYPFASTISLGVDYLLGNAPASGAAQLNLANKDISWETTETTNFGIDMGLFNSKLTISAEYYIRNTYDILLRLPIPLSIGLNAPYQNAGKVRNEGWGLSLGWNDAMGEFDYSISFNVSDVHNEVVDLVGTGPYISSFSIIREGYPINSIYGYQSIGYFQNEQEIENSSKQFGNIAPGDIKYINQLTIDTNGDDQADASDDLINASDKVIIGDPFPRYSFGINLSGKFKGFDLSMYFQGVGKRDVFLRGDAVWAFQNAGKIQVWHSDFWSPDNPDAKYPRLVATTNHNNFETSDFWVWESSYLRLRNVTLAYSLPAIWVNRISSEKLRLYFSGQNLFTIDQLPPGLDPDVPNGTTGAYYPITTIYTFGINLTF